MKFNSILMFFVLVAGLVMASCTKEVKVAVTGVSLDKVELNLVEGETAELVATVTPEDAANVNVTWSTSDEAVATVDNGKVTAVAAGEAVITVTTEDGGKTAECKVTVTAAVVAVENVTLDKTGLTIYEGETAALVATVTPENATNKNITWSSSNESVATVDNGTVTAVATGEAVITVTTEDGGKTATCTVVVEPAPIPVESVTLNAGTLKLEVGEAGTLTATVNPDDATNKNVTWSTSDAAVATVADGVVTAVAEGEAVITVTTEDGGKTATCTVTVVPVPAFDIVGNTYSGDNVAFGGEGVQLSASVPVTWSSSDESVATVDENGFVAFLNAKDDVDVTITATATDGSNASSSIDFHCYKTTTQLNDDSYPIGSIIPVPKGKFRNFYLMSNGKKVDIECYDFEIEDTEIMSGYQDSMVNGVCVRGVSAGTTRMTLTLSGGLQIKAIFKVE